MTTPLPETTDAETSEATVPARTSWPPNWVRAVGCAVGFGLMIWETVIGDQTPMVYVLGFLLTGLPVAQGVDSILGGITGRAP